MLSTTRLGGNYAKEEDVAITRAYIYVSTDAIVGSEQREGKLYERICDMYKKKILATPSISACLQCRRASR